MRPQQEQQAMAEKMLAFLNQCPDAPEISESRNFSFLYHFEAARRLLVHKHILQCGFGNNDAIDILDFGFLTGLTQEFTHRAFPNARFRVFDLPDGSVFKNDEYLRQIQKRKYLSLEPGDFTQFVEIPGKYDVIHLGEIIEHIDPTAVAKALKVLRACAKPKCCLIITTPNKRGLYNCRMTLRWKGSIEIAPIPNPLHGYGHIHLWAPDVLNQTAEFCGWKSLDTSYYHGREAEMFERVREKWPRDLDSLKAYLSMRWIECAAERQPRKRGFFVSSFSPV